MSWKSRKEHVVVRFSRKAWYRRCSNLRASLDQIDAQIIKVCRDQSNETYVWKSSSLPYCVKFSIPWKDAHWDWLSLYQNEDTLRRKKILSGDIVITFVKSNDQLPNIFLKTLTISHNSYTFNELCTWFICPILWGSVR